jgi:hypothetical protein
MRSDARDSAGVEEEHCARTAGRTLVPALFIVADARAGPGNATSPEAGSTRRDSSRRAAAGEDVKEEPADSADNQRPDGRVSGAAAEDRRNPASRPRRGRRRTQGARVQGAEPKAPRCRLHDRDARARSTPTWFWIVLGVSVVGRLRSSTALELGAARGVQDAAQLRSFRWRC